MDKKFLVYKLVSLIPKGKVTTYGEIAKSLNIKSSRLVGRILHQNQDQKNIPCHRVVFSDGSLAKTYAFGGEKEQKKKLAGEGIAFKLPLFRNRKTIAKVNLKRHLCGLTKALRLYFYLLQKFGEPGKWPWFSNSLVSRYTKEEIVISSILTQNTNWKNVERAITNLRREKANTIKAIYQLGKKNLPLLKQLVRPSGFYNQKTERLWNFSKFIIDEYKKLDNFFKLSLMEIRKELLNLKGIGKETADTILLYAGDKPIFVIDAYTKRFAQKFHLIDKEDYLELQKYFLDNLPKNVQLYQDYHALIVRWGKISG